MVQINGIIPKIIAGNVQVQCKLCGEKHNVYPGKKYPYYTCEGPIGKRDGVLHRHRLKKGDEVEYEEVKDGTGDRELLVAS